MLELSMVGVDLAKRVFQLHGVDDDGAVIFRKKLTRPQFERFLGDTPASMIVFEACASAHHWGRTAIQLGHEVRLIAPAHCSRCRAGKSYGATSVGHATEGRELRNSGRNLTEAPRIPAGRRGRMLIKEL